MQQVPTVVFSKGKPVHHGVVERDYDKLREIIQMYVLHKQEDRRLVWPPVVQFSPIDQHNHHIHMTAWCVRRCHRAVRTAYVCDTRRSSSHVHVSFRRSSLAMPHRGSAS